jgi:hypothetical protein
MYSTLGAVVAMAVCTVFAAGAFAQSARNIRGPSPLKAPKIK